VHALEQKTCVFGQSEKKFYIRLDVSICEPRCREVFGQGPFRDLIPASTSRPEGFDVHTAASGKAAKAALAQSSYDIVITDLSMESRTSGYEVIHAAQALTTRPATVVVSGFPELLDQWRTEGADAGLQMCQNS